MTPLSKHVSCHSASRCGLANISSPAQEISPSLNICHNVLHNCGRLFFIFYSRGNERSLYFNWDLLKGNAIFRKEKKNKIANANVAPVLPDENCLPGAYTKKSFLAVPLSLNFKLLKPC